MHQLQVIIFDVLIEHVADGGLFGSTLTFHLINVLVFLSQLIKYNSLTSTHQVNASGQSHKNSSSSSQTIFKSQFSSQPSSSKLLL